MAEKMPIEKKKVITPEFRVSYPHVFQPKGFAGQEPKFSVAMIFPKSTNLKDLKLAAMNAAQEKWGPKEKWPKGLKLPFRDGDVDRPEVPDYANSIFVSATSKSKPQVINQRMERLAEQDDAFYAGCYARASLIAFAYEFAGKVGVSFALQNLQKLRDGDRLGGRRDATQEFDAVADDSDNAENYTGGGDPLGF